ncbi:helix-turn-helix transcriptional regulator [Gracilibacillus oryzae]|uniref:Helix-turn-helix transcriptional regulator n=2 Tax=Gracilibacillus oryzae TaxID=1672701 RepID=A0A7C8GS89_9BACI|nr:helix-turn-helix transcriptional regulator [Gracilibacillus oryzae]
MMLIFQERLKGLREEYEFKQEEMAKKLNISTSAYGYYEQGRNEPSLETIKEISATFNVSTDYLLGLTNVKNSANLSADELNHLTYEELDSINFLKQSKLLEEISIAPKTDLHRLERLWHFIKNELDMEKEQK